MTRSNINRLWLVGLTLLLVGVGIGLRDPWPSDEPRFALVAKEMVDSGQWLIPTRGGEYYPDKPPLFMWLVAGFYLLIGDLAIALLLPSLLAAIGTVLLVYDLARRLWSDDVALVAGLILLTAPQFVLEARAGQIDAVLMFWVAAGVYGFLRHYLAGPAWGWYFTAWAACGAGVITKGVGFLPLLLFLPLALVPHVRHRGPLLAPLAGLGLMLTVICAWLLPMLLMVEASGDPALEAYRNNILFQQTAERYVTPPGHLQPVWYFVLEVIPLFWLPVTLLLPWALPHWARAFRRRGPVEVLTLGWVILVVVFFSLSPGKRGVYVLPALPWIAMLCAPVLHANRNKLSLRRWTAVAAAAVVLALIAAAITMQWFWVEKSVQLLERYAFDVRPSLWVASAITAALLIALLWLRRPLLALTGVMGGLWLCLALIVYPSLNPTKSGSALLERVERRLHPDQPLALLDWREQTLLQARRPAAVFGYSRPMEEQVADALSWLSRNPEGRILLQERTLGYFDRGEPAYLGLAHRRHWYLVGPHNVPYAQD